MEIEAADYIKVQHVQYIDLLNLHFDLNNNH